MIRYSVLLGLFLSLPIVLVGRDPSFVRCRHAVTLRVTYPNAAELHVSLGTKSITQTGSPDGTQRTAILHTAVEPGVPTYLGVRWLSGASWEYSGQVSVEYFTDPGEEVFVNTLPFGRMLGNVASDPNDPEANSYLGWQMRLVSSLVTTSRVGESSRLALGETNWSVSLGLGDAGRILDPITLGAAWSGTPGLSPASLNLPAGGEIMVYGVAPSERRQVLAPQALADIHAYKNAQDTTIGFEARFYARKDVGTLQNGLYTLADQSTPFVVHRVTRPNPTSTHLVHTRVVGTDEETDEINPLGANSWRRTGPGGLVIEERSQVTLANGNLEETRILKGSDQVIARKTLLELQTFDWGCEAVRRVDDPDGAALTTHYAFYADSGQPESYGRLKHTIHPDGNWVRNDFHLSGAQSGRLHRVLRPFLDAPSHPDLATTANSATTTTTDVADWNGTVRLPAEVIEQVLGVQTGRTVTQWAFPQVTLYGPDGGLGYPAPGISAAASRYPNAGGPPVVSTTLSLRPAATLSPAFWNKVVSVTQPDGTLTEHRWSTGADVSEYRFTAPLVAGRSLRYGTIRKNGLRTEEQVEVWDHPPGPLGQGQPLGWQLLSKEKTEHGAPGRPERKERGHENTAGSRPTSIIAYGDDGRVSAETAEDGSRAEYTYDAAGRVLTKTLKGVVAPTYAGQSLPALPDRVWQYRYDGAGNRVEERLTGPSGALVSSQVFDLAGRVVQTRVPGPSGPLTTTFTYAILPTGGTRITATAPDGGTTVTTTYRDGRARASEGTAQVNRSTTYTVGADGRLTTTVNEGPRWTATVTDWLGRTVESTRPAETGGTFVETRSYNALGQHVATSSNLPGSRPYRYVYDSLGEKSMEGVDLDNSGALEPASSDRITTFETGYAFQVTSGSPYSITHSERIVTTRSLDTIGSATVTLRSQVRTKLGWWAAGELAREDTSGDSGPVTVRTTVAGGCRVTTRTGDRTDVTVAASGKTLRSIQGPITTTFRYDDLDRLLTQTDARKGDTEWIYFTDSPFVSAMVDPADLAANRVTQRFTYDAAGRKSVVLDALDQARRYGYDLHGRVVREWGAAAYPIERTYCSCGQLTELRTYRGGTGWDGAVWPGGTAGAADLTRWTYGATTGLLLAKTDANNAAVTYAYDLAGRRSTRTWARGVVTTYAYDPATGDLTGTSYSDGTPSVSNTYDRRGRIATVVDGSGSRSFTYTASGQVADETIIYTGEPARTLTSTYDAWSRRTRLFGPGGLDTNVGYSATTGLPSLAGMAYLPNSALPAVAPNGTAFAWSATRDSLSEADNLWGATDWTFTYARDALSRITQQTLDLDSGQSVTVRPFGYNARSEVTVSTAESYAYDAQGNRTAGNGQGYTPNALNQYTVVGAATWTYDADGNLTSDGVRTFVYDGENRLTQAAGFTFTYDYRHRVAKQTGTWRPWGGWSSGAAGIAHRYYDGAKVVYRRDVCGGYTQEAGYAWGPDLAGRVVGGDGTGGLASVYSNGRTYYPIHDGRGNIWGFTEGGQTVITRNLTTFGDGAFNPYQNVPVYVPVSLLGFAHGTKEFIPALGLYLFGRRIYDPKTGRFLNRDPIAEDGGLNLYRFVSNNPVNAWDDNGLEPTAMAKVVVEVTPWVDPKPPVSPYLLTSATWDWEVEMAPEPIEVPPLPPPCWQLALEMLASAPGDIAAQPPATRADLNQLDGMLARLVVNGGDLGAALVLGWLTGNAQLQWSTDPAEGPGATQLPDGRMVLRLNPGDPEFTYANASGPEYPSDPALIVGHELGHAVARINGYFADSKIYVTIGGNTFDLGVETATVLLVENSLRGGFGEGPRTHYSGIPISTEYFRDSNLQDYVASQVERVDAMIADMKARNECY